MNGRAPPHLNGSATATTDKVTESLIFLDDNEKPYAPRDVEKAELGDLPCPWISMTAIQSSVSWPRAHELLSRFLFALLPSFVQRRLRHEPRKPDRLHPTAYLDGVRGLAAFIVFICHLTYNCFVITYGYGQGDQDENWYFLQLPIIRLLYSGPPMVCVFFVVSGYALSVKPLKQLRGREWDKLMMTMQSATLRRGFRLFLPTIISTLLVSLMLWIGIYDATRDFAENSELLWHVREPHPERLDGLFEQLYNWVSNMFYFIGVFSWDSYAGSTMLDVHLWTIPVEYRSSLYLFLVIVGLSRARAWIRLAAMGSLMWFVMRCDRWELFLFLSGAFLAELDLIRQANASRGPPAETAKNGNQQRMKLWWTFVCLVGLYLMSQPDEYAEETPGWVWLCAMIPRWFSVKYRFWQCIGSVIFMWSVSSASFLQRPFTTPFVQYLGKLSYALYLMHGPVIHVIGYAVEPWAWAITGYTTYEAYVAGFLLSSLIVVPSLFWAADVFWRLVDIPCVKFARWVEEQVCVTDD